MLYIQYKRIVCSMNALYVVVFGINFFLSYLHQYKITPNRKPRHTP